MGYSTLIHIIFVVFLIPEGLSTEEELTVVTREFERIPLYHALSTLEEIVKEEKVIEEFCFRHFDVGRKPVNEEKSCDRKPTNCADLFNGGKKSSGVYTIDAAFDFSSMKQIRVYCDMETDGGGWTVFQRRGPFPLLRKFYRNWNEYAVGFGNLEEEFWLGNDNVHGLSEQSRVTLRIDLEDFEGNKRYATYKGFTVESSERNYTLDYDEYSGDAGDSLTEELKGKSFFTYDRDNENKCAKQRKGGWWYGLCAEANLNGEYNNTRSKRGILWYSWLGDTYNLKKTEMKLRNENFDPHRVRNLC